MAPPLKSILKNKSKGQQEAGPSKPSKGSKGTVKASISAKVEANTKANAKTKTGKGKRKHEDSDVEMEESDNSDDFPMDDELDTEDEIEIAQATGSESTSKKALKRKRQTTAAEFGSTLATLLTESSKPAKKAKGGVPTTEAATTETKTKTKSSSKPAPAPILSLSNKPLPRSLAAEKLERRAARQLKAEREARLDRARVRNVLEGWVPAEGADTGSQEFERALRKTAQRGVIKLFNAILVASKNAEQNSKTLSAQAGIKPEGPKNRKEKDNILGRGGRDDVLTKESFLDLVRKGGSK